MKAKREFQKIDNCVIENTTLEGKGVVRLEGKVIFVDMAVVGDVVNIEVYKNNRRFSEARILSFVTKSDHRVEPHCNHFEMCGGCRLQHIDYAHQLTLKNQTVIDNLTRIGKIENATYLPILGSEQTTYYRNKQDYAFCSKRWLTVEEIQTMPEGVDRSGVGIHIAGRFDKVLDLEHCYHQEDPSNDIRNTARQYALDHKIEMYDPRSHEGVLRNLIIRCTTKGEWMVIVAFTELNDHTIGLMEELKNKFSIITALMYTINTKKNDIIHDLDIISYNGADHIKEQLGNYTFKIGPKSFFQTNSKQAKHLYDTAVHMAEIKNTDLVYDLYSGVGSISIYISHMAKKVVGIELVEAAVADAKVNAALNDVENCAFYASDMKNLLSPAFIETNGMPDIIITDPPRAGMDEKVVRTLLEVGCKKIVYISCNSATQARDLEWLSEKYKVVKSQAVDMFPQTAHVENVVLLELK